MLCSVHVCMCVHVWWRQARGVSRVLLRVMRCDETQFEWVHTSGGRDGGGDSVCVCVCVKVDENEQENKRGKIDINGYELAWPTIFFYCSWSKLRRLTQQLGCFSGHSKSCTKRVARPKSTVNLMEWKTPQPSKGSKHAAAQRVTTSCLMSSCYACRTATPELIWLN